jgi:thiamine pyrophosphokinase
MQSPPISQDDAVPIRTDRLLVIVGGGDVDAALLTRLAEKGALVVGADGGADAALEAGVTPDLVIGDLDSLEDPETWRKRARVIHIAEQETTDFEKCLYSVEAPVTVALGMTGKRFDHTLAALHAVTRFGTDRRIVLVDTVDAALALSGPMACELPAGTRVSVHPLQAVHFAGSEGLAYPLDGLTLMPGIRTGTSNKATGGPVRITPDVAQNGVWLFVLPVAELDTLMAASFG